MLHSISKSSSRICPFMADLSSSHWPCNCACCSLNRQPFKAAFNYTRWRILACPLLCLLWNYLVVINIFWEKSSFLVSCVTWLMSKLKNLKHLVPTYYSLLVTLWSGLFLLHFWWQRICVSHGCCDSSVDCQDLCLLESYFVHSHESTGKWFQPFDKIQL